MSKEEMAKYLQEHKDDFREYTKQEIDYVISVWTKKERCNA